MNPYLQHVHNVSDVGSIWLLNKGKNKKSVDDFRINFLTNNSLQEAILASTGSEVLEFVSKHIDVKKDSKHIIFTTHSKTHYEGEEMDDISSIVNFKKINHIRNINEHLRSVNKLLPCTGIYIGRIEIYKERKKRFHQYFGYRLGSFLWLVDFVINRIIPKIRPLEKIYTGITRKSHQVISQAEILGRLVYSGFEIIEYQEIDNLFYFVAQKSHEPLTDKDPSYHSIIKMKRVGKNGKIINVYKFRTMHPYSEYLQGLVIKMNGYNEFGKPADDFRIARWGILLRKFWLDEFPQFLNVLKGEMCIVGVRPLSKVRYNEFPEDLKLERIKYKPGCFPPYVALNMPDDKGNIEAERIYLNDKKMHPYTTDIRYFCLALYNIFIKRLRSS